ncbi:hypothetical protein [Bythopirellula polymerisocia]|uniref:hypothetical protein n=1 Tax=Bythopirellula polymerisocia TaxID=2528003 RepID=UPI0011B50F4B|nr:hypothetical protein [Bythopirellula polymerisocia]
MKTVIHSCSVLVFLLIGQSSTFAWWNHGHRHITEGAIEYLPYPLKGFFQSQAADLIFMSGQEPPGAHYIDIDVYPEFFAGTFPRDLDVLVGIYGAPYVTSVGKGPWTFVDYVETLTAAMAAASSQQDWIDLISLAAAQAHYIEDLHNPLHLTYNYNGQYTGNTGIHARYEGEMIFRHLDELTFSETEAAYVPSMLDFVFDGIDSHYGFVEDILAADTMYTGPHDEAYYAGMWAETGEFTHDLFQQAAEAVAASWYTAWVNAGSPRTFLAYSADFEGDGDVDALDLDLWQTAYGIRSVADADVDADTDGADFLQWQRQFGSNFSTSSTLKVVPEPISRSLCFLALTLAGCWPRLK